ncbi:MAG: hypothetical protein ACK5X0_05480, partial [Rhodospirillales bacterium]
MTGTTVHTRWDGVKRGFWRAQPMAVGVFVYGVACGLLGREAGIWRAEASAMAMAVYSGAGQVAAAT